MRMALTLAFTLLTLGTAYAADPVVQSVDRTKAAPSGSTFRVTFDKEVTLADAEKAVAFVKAAVDVSRSVAGEPDVRLGGKTVTVTVGTDKLKAAGTDFTSLQLKERTATTSTYEVRFEKKPNRPRSNTVGGLVGVLDSAERGIGKDKKVVLKTEVKQDGALSVITLTYSGE